MGANESPFGPSPKAVEAMIAKAIALMADQTPPEPVVHRIASELVVRATTAAPLSR